MKNHIYRIGTTRIVKAKSFDQLGVMDRSSVERLVLDKMCEGQHPDGGKEVWQTITEVGDYGENHDDVCNCDAW